MRSIIQKLSRCKLVFLITLTALIMAICTDYGLAIFFGHEFNFDDLTRATIIPLIIAPFVSWYLVGLIYRLDKTERRMTSLARLDSLTGLLNRRAFYDEYELHLSEKSDSRGAFILLDLDHFKRVNDEYGHLAGDAVLRAISALLIEQLPEEATIARFGGEEFALLLPSANASTVKQQVEELLSAVCDLTIRFEASEISVTTSAGGYVFPKGQASSLHSAYQLADRALYMAKESGRNRFILSDV
ncbi:GGDEF domain-containing protein [Marinomonas ostreistagni]|uniref:diguanylate cyclase n=1 Tax=Marinomonas ostreistagni TaxID=359209 RepID=A0ABS0Z940_9GAMM|nr:diguanylate cyclase [Marinomonas ostreistagni]MBJ7549728.1 diguanylate cyclase [Marinomonas ostreistagni]